MTDEQTRFESQLMVAFGAFADAAPVAVDARAMTATARRDASTSPAGRWRTVRIRRHQGYLVIAATLLLVSLLIGAVLVGSRPRELLTSKPVATPSVESSVGPRIAYQGVFVPIGPFEGSDKATSLATDAFVRLSDGRVLVVGDSFPDRRQQALWDPATGRFTPAGLSVGKREQPIGVLLDDGRVLILGGDIRPTGDGGGVATYSTAELYDPAAGTFTAAGPMVGKGWAPSAIRLADGRVLILDGISVDDAYAPNPLLATAELYDPVTDTFSATGPMAIARGPAHMALLDDGRVLVVGGAYPETGVVDLFDPSTSLFTPTASLPPAGPHPEEGKYWPEVAAGAVRLPDGRILVPGRRCMEIQSISEGRFPTAAAIYDPSTAAFVTSTPMPHCVETATSLPDGRVFLTGFWGETNWSGIYDPATDAVTETAAPPAGRYVDVVGLQDGSVLVVGGGVVTVFR